MREIICKGKTYKGEWTEGNLIDWGNHVQVYIFPLLDFATSYDLATSIRMYAQAVDPETVGQYAGKTDRNGKRIFEGDIVKVITPIGHESGVVVFHEGSFCVKTSRAPLGYISLKRTDGRSFEVIGNIHDNEGGEG